MCELSVEVHIVGTCNAFEKEVSKNPHHVGFDKSALCKWVSAIGNWQGARFNFTVRDA
jgi:hypothetical protein